MTNYSMILAFLILLQTANDGTLRHYLCLRQLSAWASHFFLMKLPHHGRGFQYAFKPLDSSSCQLLYLPE